jgi:hypothetical protein
MKRWASAKYFQFSIKMRWIPSEIMTEFAKQINSGDISGSTE